MSRRQLTVLLFALLTSPVSSDSFLTGRLKVSHPGFGEYTFTDSFLFVEELEDYFPVGPDGAFEIAFRREGEYVIQTVCPGFVAATVPVSIPYEGELLIELDLQIIEITVKVVQEIPEHILNLRGTIESIESESPQLTDNQYHNLLNDSLGSPKSPTIDFVKVFDFLKDAVEKRKDERARRRAEREERRRARE
jgi:hypothetical protein